MHTRRFVVTVAVVSVGSLGASPAGAAKPACAIDNEGTHTEYATLQAAVDAASPGAMWNFGGAMTLRDTVVSGNSAGYQGGGLRNQTPAGDPAGVLTLIGATTISGNDAGDSGGGVSDVNGVYDVTAWAGSIFSNTPDQCSPAVPALGC
jgi:hypothetical protein